jgi:colanic acid biosynthesis glycosyl transferase WcaI
MTEKSTRVQTLWIVSELYYPEKTSTGYLLTVMAEGWAVSRPVRVICGQPTYSARHLETPPPSEVHGGVRIRRCWATRFNKDRLLKRIVNHLTLSLSMFFYGLFAIRRRDMVLVVTNPPILPFLTALLCKLKRASLVLLVHDLYPEYAVAAGVLKSNAWITRLWSWAMQRLCRTVDKIVVLGRDMQDVLRKKRGDRPEDVDVITNWADVDEVYPTSRRENRLLRELGLTDKFIVQYAGNIGRVQDHDMLVEAASQLSDHPEIHFLVIGAGGRREYLKSLIEKCSLKNITLLPPRPRADSCEFLNACDVGISLFVPKMYGVAVPSRTYNILAAAKPIISVTDPGTELDLFLKEEDAGWVVPVGDVRGFVEAVVYAWSHPEETAAKGKRGRAVVESKYRPEQVVGCFSALFDQLSKGQ